MNHEPMEDRIIVLVDEPATMTSGVNGVKLNIPETGKEKPQKGTVIAAVRG